LLAVVTKTDGGYTARFERRLKHPVEKVWAFLTETEKLAKWFPELSIDDLREGGVVKFDMQDGTFEELKILELKPLKVFEYMWGEDQVRFELYPEADGSCRLVLIEKIHKLTDHSPKDLAGWHVCLDVLAAVLDDREAKPHGEQWEKRYAEYAPIVSRLRDAA